MSGVRPALLLTVLAIAVMAIVACGDDGEDPAGSGDPALIDSARPPAATPTAEATPETTLATPEVARDPQPVTFEPAFEHTVFNRPVEAGAWPPGGPEALFVVEQDGRIFMLDDDGGEMIADLRERVSRTGNEEGLLSLALDPTFEENRYVWAYYSGAVGPPHSVLSRFSVPEGQAAIDGDSELIVMQVDQPYSNHNGGAIRFGPDGMLYLGFGDGGSGGDPQGHGQNTQTLLGSIIRIDVSDVSEDEPYRVPGDNPFIDDPDVLDEIWAYGLRNPWRMEFDEQTGALWVADVGQADVEEVSIAEAGDNLGWAIMEGDICYPPGTECDKEGLKMPVVTYANASGRCSITGGPIYRGSAVPEVAGSYLFSDFCSGEVWAMRVDEPSDPVTVAEGLGNVVSFAVGPDESIYVLAFDSPLQRLATP